MSHTLLKEIHDTEILNKHAPTHDLTRKLATLRETLRKQLSQQYDKYLRRLQLNYYANGNRAGKYLANRLKAAHTKSRIPFLQHPTMQHKIVDPQAIANQFADYYR